MSTRGSAPASASATIIAFVLALAIVLALTLAFVRNASAYAAYSACRGPHAASCVGTANSVRTSAMNVVPCAPNSASDCPSNLDQTI